MKTYIVLLRGINVSGKNKIPMASLRQVIESLGYSNVITYIQSGNIVFNSLSTNAEEVEESIASAITNTFGFSIRVLVLLKEDLVNVLSKNPFSEKQGFNEASLYFVFLKEMPDSKLVENLQEEKFVTEKLVILNNCVYLECSNGYGKAKCNNNLVEKRLKVIATTRNFNTLNRLIEISSRY